MKQILTSALLLFIISAFHACKFDGGVVYKNVTGKAGELIVVMSKAAWNDTTGSLVRHTLAQPHPALPQDEPLFDLINVPPEAFKDIFKSTRNILQTRISSVFDTCGINFQNNLWAFPQTCIQIQARNTPEFDSLFRLNTDKILAHYLKGEIDRSTLNYEKYYDRTVFNYLQKNLNLTLNVPPGFSITKKDKNYTWIRYETPEISQGIFLFTYDYTSDSTFTPGYLTSKRDSMLRLYVPGPTENSYMSSEKRIDPIFKVSEHYTNYAAEMRGLWRVENDFMGGPYITLSELDAQRQRIVEAFGYVYAPGKNKRNLLRQVEAMIYTLKFENQDLNDKINSQVKMGN